MSVELHEIRSLNEMIIQKNSELLEQLAVYEGRQEYVHGALAESERIAREIARNAEIRVEKIMTNAQEVVVPQQERIARIEKEIVALTDEIRLSKTAKPESKPEHIEMPLNQRKFSLLEPQYAHADHIEDQTEEVAVGSQPGVRREFSLRKYQEHDIAEIIDQPAAASQYNPETMVQREFSLRNPLEQDLTEIIEVKQPDASQYTPEPFVRREFSLRNPQEQYIPEFTEANQPDSSQYRHDPVPAREFSLRIPQVTDILAEKTEVQKYEISSETATEETLSEPGIGELTNYNLAMSLMEQHESDMHLDVFVDTRYVVTCGEDIGQTKKNSWQVKITVEIPKDNNQYIGYAKVSAAVTSTLLRYDNVVLNDVYPFGIITPNPENIAMYFYNCLQDTVAMLGLVLKEITIWENQILIMQVNHRNDAFDDKLQKGDDILHDIRSLFTARDQSECKTDRSIKGKLGHVFKNR